MWSDDATVNLSLKLDKELWRTLRSVAEHDRDAGGRASVAHVIRRTLHRAFSEKITAAKRERCKA